jgi:hypothetical protein
MNWTPTLGAEIPAHGKVDVKIIDWGQAVLEDENCENGSCGQPSFECWDKTKKQPQKSARDVFACGVMLMQLIYPQVIFPNNAQGKTDLDTFYEKDMSQKLAWLKDTGMDKGKLSDSRIVRYKDRSRELTTCLAGNPVKCQCGADSHWCDDLRDLVMQMLAKEEDRITLERVLEHSWFTRQLRITPQKFTELMARHLAPWTIPASDKSDSAGGDQDDDLVDKGGLCDPDVDPEPTISASKLLPHAPLETCTFFYTRFSPTRLIDNVKSFFNRKFGAQLVSMPQELTANRYAVQHDGAVVHAKLQLLSGSFDPSPFGFSATQVGFTQCWLRVLKTDDEELLMVQMHHGAGDYAAFLHVFHLIEEMFTRPRREVRLMSERCLHPLLSLCSWWHRLCLMFFVPAATRLCVRARVI